jgi:hypothetical protein
LHEFKHVTKQVWDVEEEGISREILEGAPTKVVLNPIMCKQISRLWVHGYNKLLSSPLAIKFLVLVCF